MLCFKWRFDDNGILIPKVFISINKLLLLVKEIVYLPSSTFRATGSVGSIHQIGGFTGVPLCVQFIIASKITSAYSVCNFVKFLTISVVLNCEKKESIRNNKKYHLSNYTFLNQHYKTDFIILFVAVSISLHSAVTPLQVFGKLI